MCDPGGSRSSQPPCGRRQEDGLGALGVVPLQPVVPDAELAEYEVVEDLAGDSRAHQVHGARREVEHGATAMAG